jgi:RNA polymerase sigma factor (sigma-70 family)
MPEPTFDSVQLQQYLERWQSGDRAAADELLRASGARLEKLVRRMMRGFPNVRGQAEIADILQNSLLRLLHTLQILRPKTTRDFFNLAAVHIRRELLDLARRCKGKPWLTVNLDSERDGPTTPVAQTDANQAEDFDMWMSFHEAVEELPLEEREVVGLVFYHGWTQIQIADLFQVDVRTIRRRWSSARQHLRNKLGNDLFEE